MSIEYYQIPAQVNPVQATDEIVVSDRTTVAGTGMRAFHAVLRAMGNYVGALASTDLVPVKTATGTGWRSIADLVNSGPINHQEGSGDPVVTEGVTGDATFRVRILSNGRIEWADGTNASDVALLRGGAGILATLGQFSAMELRTAQSSASSIVPLVATNQENGTYIGAYIMGSVGIGIPSWDHGTVIEAVGGEGSGSGHLVLGSYRGLLRFQVNARVTVGEVAWDTGIWTFKNGGTAVLPNSGETTVGGGRVRTYEAVMCETGSFHVANNQGLYIAGTLRFSGDGSSSHVRSPDQTIRIQVWNAASYYDNGEHRFRDTAGTGDGTVYMGNLYRAGSLQPASMVTFFNNPASSYTTLIDLNTVNGSMWELTVGNATEGYMARAVFGKPSSSAGAVLLSEVHNHADLTITLSGNDIRINNGVSAIRTTFYTLTKLY